MGEFYKRDKAFVAKLWDLVVLVWQCFGTPIVLGNLGVNNFSIWMAAASFVNFHIWVIVGYQMWKRRLSGTALYKFIVYFLQDLIGIANDWEWEHVPIPPETKGAGGPIFHLLQIMTFLGGLSLWLVFFDISFGAPFSEVFWKLTCFIITVVYTLATMIEVAASLGAKK